MLNKQTCIVKDSTTDGRNSKVEENCKKKSSKNKWVLKIDECQIKQKGVKSHGFS